VIRLVTVLLAVAALCLGCGASGSTAKPTAAETAQPKVHACRNLSRADVAEASNDSPVVDCADPHNAETYAAGPLPEKFADVSAEDATDDDDLADWAYHTCTAKLEKHLGADQSLLMRSMLSWVWFGPSKAAWEAGARWYRCDLVGGGQAGAAYVDLPTVTRNLLHGSPDDRWLACARGASVDTGEKVSCADRHSWRAVTTIKLGSPDTPYPGDAAIVAKSKQYCSSSVHAWLSYPATYDYGYTWFGKDEWAAGDRRSVCWAKTDE